MQFEPVLPMKTLGANAKIKRVKTGVAGLDEMIGGGIPEGHSMLVLGSFGTGKTTMGLQFMWEGLQEKEKCLFITLEESVDSLVKDAYSFGWDLKPYIEKRQLALFDLQANHLRDAIRLVKNDMYNIMKEFKANRVVIDSISLVEMLNSEEYERRITLRNICELLKSTGATSLITCETKNSGSMMSRFGYIEYVVDGIILLEPRPELDAKRTLLTIRVLKLKRSGHTRDIKLYIISDKGIKVQTDVRVR